MVARLLPVSAPAVFVVLLTVACSGRATGTILIGRQAAENAAIASANASQGPGITLVYPLVDVHDATGRLVARRTLALRAVALSVVPGRYEVIYHLDPNIESRSAGAAICAGWVNVTAGGTVHVVVDSNLDIPCTFW